MHLRIFWFITMTKICEITGKRFLSGHKVSHSNRKAKKKFNPNLQSRRVWLAEENRFIKMRISAKGIRTIDKVGIEKILDNLK